MTTTDHRPEADTSDAEALDRVAAAVAVPRVEEGDSFVLHAPLEALARSALLTLAGPADRGPILDQLAAVGDQYRNWGHAVEREPQHPPSLQADPAGVLVDAIADGDLDTADDAITWLTAHLDAGELVRVLAEPVLPSLSAAAHGSILLYLLPRVAARSLPAAGMARTTVNQLARHPDWGLTWLASAAGERPAHVDVDGGGRGGGDQPALEAELASRLARPQLEQQPGSTFIFPTMAAVDTSGLAAELLGDLGPGLTVAAARRALLATAAHSMLQDDPDHAAYGWSHCLTMPQAALGIAGALPDPTLAVSVAATYVLGFRATLASTTVELDRTPEPRSIDPAELLTVDPTKAAAAAWHAPAADHAAIWRLLAGHAGAHQDAHLAKYTLACLDATRADPDRADLFRAAATYLNAWWAVGPDRTAA